MMMMSNTAKKKESRTPRMICSSLVNRPSTTERGRGDRLDNVTQKHNNRLYRFLLSLINTGMNARTCSFDMLRVLRVCGLAVDVSGSELKPGEQQLSVSIMLP